MYHTDLVGVFHGRIFELFEEARTEAFRRLGFEYLMTEQRGIAMIVTAVDAAFHAPLRMDDEVLVGVFVDRLTRVRVAIAYEVRGPDADRLAVTGHTHFAFVDV